MTFRSKLIPFILVFLQLLCCMGSMAHAQTLVRARADANRITIGDQIRFWLEVQPATDQTKVGWAHIPDSIPGLEIIEKGPVDTIKASDTLLFRQRIILTGFDSGAYYIPAFSFEVQDGNQTQLLFTDSLPLQVHTIEVDTTQAIKPIKEIIEVPFSIWDYWMIIVGILLLLGLLVFLWYYFVKNKKVKIPTISKQPVEKPHQKAMRLLNELEAKQRWQQGQVKEYYSELSDITRIYLEERFGIAAMEQTTDELLATLKKQSDARAELRRLRSELKVLLRTADLAKFAKASPLPQEHIDCMTAAKEIVIRTQANEEEGAL
jgi:hypothetical protein